MINETYLPHPALRAYISHIIYYEVDFTGSEPLSNIYPFYPTHPRFITFYIHGGLTIHHPGNIINSYQSKCIAIGPQLNPVTLELSEKHASIVVGFTPDGMYRLLGMPMHEMVDQHYEVDLLMGRPVNELMEQLQEASSKREQLRLVQQFFLQKLDTLRKASPLDDVLSGLIRHSGNIPIETLASTACMSTRQFERICKERLGLAPKLYARLIRFSKAYRLKEISPQLTWTDIVHRCGYYDQMHFIRDFKSFTHKTPSFLKAEDIEGSIRLQIQVVE